MILAVGADLRERAFAASELRLRGGADAADAYERIREAARLRHAEVRGAIEEGRLDRRAFVEALQAAPLELRDHLVEEILDIAYPPLDIAPSPPDAIPYTPSGLAEVLFMIERAKLGPGATFVDLGSGLGKVVLLVALLTGAEAYGAELDPELVAYARDVARALRLASAHFIEGDIREVPLPAADVYYMYIPLTRSADIAPRVAAFAAERRIMLFAQALDLRHFPQLRAVGAGSYWLEMYESVPRR